MPELPEVETTVRGLRRKVIGKTISDLWTDWPKYLNPPKNKAGLKQHIKNKTITAVSRRGKNILIHLSQARLLLIHQKMSGHLMAGRWLTKKNPKFKAALKNLNPLWQNQKWVPEDPRSPFANPKNRFIRLVFFFKDGDMLALSDLRRFAKIVCAPKKVILNLPELTTLGPEPIDASLTPQKLQEILKNKRGVIKKLLLDQTIISGIGNIYADEILWDTKIHPLTRAENLKNRDLKKLHKSAKKILETAVKNRGTSMDDYRDPSGKKGNHEKYLKAYQKTGAPCPRCKTPIQRIKVAARSSHFCPKCQK